MIKVTKDQVIPVSKHIIVEIDKSGLIKNGILLNDEELSKIKQSYYRGKVIAKSSEVSDEIEIGDNILLDKFAGSHINTGKESFIKVVDFPEVMVTYKNNKMNKENLIVHTKSVLIQELNQSDVNENGIYIGGIDTKDPRQIAMATGKVIKLSTDSSMNSILKEGDIVGFDDWCGTKFTGDDDINYRSLNDTDIRFKINK